MEIIIITIALSLIAISNIVSVLFMILIYHRQNELEIKNVFQVHADTIVARAIIDIKTEIVKDVQEYLENLNKEKI